VHDIFQDTTGYIWIATDRGISKYDGHNFITIKESQDVKNNCVFNFVESTDHNIWINTGDNRLYNFNPYAKKLAFTPYKYNDTLLKTIDKLTPTTNFIRKFHFNKQKELTISFLTYPGHLIIRKNGTSKIYHRSIKNDIILTDSHQLTIHINKEFVSSEILKSKKEQKHNPNQPRAFRHLLHPT
jgi:hypothetical protein